MVTVDPDARVRAPTESEPVEPSPAWMRPPVSTETVPAAVPVPPRTALEATVTAELEDRDPVRLRVPALTLVAPL